MNILIFLSVISITSANKVLRVDVKPCLTPNNEATTCASIYNCPSLLSNLKQNTRRHKQFFHESLCLNNKGKYLGVCCGHYSTYKSKKAPNIRSKTTQSPPPVLKKQTHPNVNLLPRDCGDAEGTSDRIFGGEETEINEFPWMTLLEYRKNGKSTKYWCAGSLINERYILTAAHCIVGQIKEDAGDLFRVRLGEHDIRFNYDSLQDIFIEETIVHPKYSTNNENKHFDIALVRLKYPAESSETVRTVCLPLNGETSKPGDELTVAGWGYTEEEIPSPIKLKVNVPYVDDNKCKKIWRKISFDFSYKLINSQFCAGGENGKDSCQKDSGGPIMTTFPRKNLWYQEGIVSFGSFCGGNTPAVYTRVSSFLTWILDNLKP